MDLRRAAVAAARQASLLLVVAVCAGLLATCAAVLRGAVYETRALVNVGQLLGDQEAFSNAERADRRVANELVVAGDPGLAHLASRRLGGVDVEDLRRNVSVEQLAGTDSIAFTARGETPRAASTTARQYAASYAAARLDQRRAALTAEADEVARELEVLQRRISTLSDDDLPQTASQRAALEERYTAVADQQLELRRRSGLEQAPEQFVLSPPVPQEPAGPGPLVWGLLAAALSLALGAAVVALRHRIHDPVEHRSEVEAAGLPVLAEVPPARNPWGRSPDPAWAVQAAALALAARDPALGVITVVSVEDQDTSELVGALTAGLSEQGSWPVRPASAPRPGGGGGGDEGRARLPAPRVHVADTPTSSRRGLASVRRSDLVVVVVVRGVTRRAELARVLDQLQHLTTAPCLALLVNEEGWGRGTEQPAPPPVEQFA